MAVQMVSIYLMVVGGPLQKCRTVRVVPSRTLVRLATLPQPAVGTAPPLDGW